MPLAVISKTDDPKETPIQRTIRLPSEINHETAQSSLAKITVQSINAAMSRRSGTVLRAELQNEDRF
jgi:hypothetical protein